MSPFQSPVRRVLIIGIISAIGLFVIVYHQKIPLGLNKINRAADEAMRSLKFKITPSILVDAGDDLTTEPLHPVRRASAAGPLRVNSTNPRYFVDGNGRAIYLTGAYTWVNFQDGGTTDPPPTFSYEKYLDFLVRYNHNFFRLWVWEEAKWITDTTGDYWIDPMPYRREGEGKALDGKAKFDLSNFHQPYFDRLRQRVVEAGHCGIYVSVMLFNGWSIEDKLINKSPSLMSPGNPWPGHPFHRDNNVNGIDGDPGKNGRGEEIHTLQILRITELQEQYVRKVIDTVNDLDNVLYEISNESLKASQDWQNRMIGFVKNYEARKSKQHPVGMTFQFHDGDNAGLFNSQADWISPAGDILRPPPAVGDKVILSDTDHLCGICGDRQWVWKSFTRGENPLFMDVYDGLYPLLDPRVPPDPQHYEPWVSLRINLGYTLTYANRVNLMAMTPRTHLASTGYCLANPAERGAEYLVYLPTGGTVKVDHSATRKELAVEWLNPRNGLVTSVAQVFGGGHKTFIAPFEGDAVLYLRGK